MKYYSTNKKAPIADLHKAVVKGLAEDRGLYMPEIIKKLPQDFFDNIEKLSFQEIAYKVADAFFGEDVDAESLKKIVYDTLAFDCPVVEVEPNIYSLELFHGPTLAFKDVGARFMARLLQYFVRQEGKEEVNVLVACIGCGKCQKVCNFDAITVENNVAYIDFNKCRMCTKCVDECPTGALVKVNFPVRKPKPEAAPAEAAATTTTENKEA